MTKAIIIGKAIRDDAVLIHELHTQSVKELCKDHYSDELIHGWIDQRTPERYFSAIDRNILFVAIEDSAIVGFGGAVPRGICQIYVLPSHIESGIGSMLLNHAMEIARVDNGKVIVESTLNAVGFYGKSGFVEIERKTTRHENVDLPCILTEYRPSN